MNAADYTDPWRAPSDFADAIAAAGLGHPDIVPDGALHRFRVEGDKPGTRNGWYVLHIDGTPAGCFGSWKLSETQTWCAVSRDQLTQAQQADIRRLMEAAKAQRASDEQERHAQAARSAAIIWDGAKPADQAHPYLVAKEVGPHGLRQQGIALVVPVYVAGQISSVQTILPDGRKRFLSGGRMSGGYCLIDDGTRRPEVLVCEGFATAASLHEEIGAAVYIAFNANNLMAVARMARARHIDQTVIICADNDQWTDGNPGLTKARAAALAIGAKLLVPDFTGMDLTGKPSDWNDWYRLRRVAAGRVAA
jgi:putative DNA primase/helicase